MPVQTSQTGSQQPIYVIREGTTRDRGSARSNNIIAAKTLADILRSTLGPKGMDKMLISSVGDVLITNDGATILRRMDIGHPAAKMLVEAALTQEREAGDGTKTAVILAGELLARAELLTEDIHPTLVVRGYRLAAEKAADAIDALARRVSLDDDKTLLAIARTSMASKLAAAQAPAFAEIAMHAVRAIARAAPSENVPATNVDLARVKFVKRTGGELSDSVFVEGIILERARGSERMPKSIRDARVLLLDDAVKVHKLERSAKLSIKDPSQLAGFASEEQRMLKAEVDSILASGANAVFCQGEIVPDAMEMLEHAGVLAIEHVTSDDSQALARATGAMSTRTSDIVPRDVGRAGLIEERTIGQARLTFVTECPQARAVSILLRGGTNEILDEAQRSLEDALGVLRDMLRDGRALPGAGAPEIEVASTLRRYAASLGGKEQLAVEAFADAVEIIPRTLAENAGLDAIDILVRLRSEHEAGRGAFGLDIIQKGVFDAWDAGILEPVLVKRQAIESAAEVACMILRIDDVIASAPRKVPKVQ